MLNEDNVYCPQHIEDFDNAESQIEDAIHHLGILKKSLAVRKRMKTKHQQLEKLRRRALVLDQVAALPPSYAEAVAQQQASSSSRPPTNNSKPMSTEPAS